MSSGIHRSGASLFAQKVRLGHTDNAEIRLGNLNSRVENGRRAAESVLPILAADHSVGSAARPCWSAAVNVRPMKAEAPRTPKYSRLTRRVFTSTGGLPSTLTLCLSNALCPASVAEKDWVRPRRASNSRVERLLRSPVDVPDADASEGRVGERNQLLKIFDRQQLEEDGVDQAEDGGVGADSEGPATPPRRW